MGFTREQYLQSAQKALMFFAINVALITYHKLNKSAPDGDAAAFEAAEPKSLGEQVGSFFAFGRHIRSASLRKTDKKCVTTLNFASATRVVRGWVSRANSTCKARRRH